MQSKFRITDSAGVIEHAGEGFGFCLMPGRALADLTVRPGGFPVAVKFASGKRVEVTGPHAFYFAPSEFRGERDRSFRVETSEANASWNVITFDDPTEGVRFGNSQRIVTRLQAATAGQTTTPTGTDGWEVKHTTRSITFYATGTLQVGRIWQRDVDGNWIDTLEDFDFSAQPVLTRYVEAPGRVALKFAAATINLRVEVMEEVG